MEQSIIKLNEYEVNNMTNILDDIVVDIENKDQVIDLIDCIDDNNDEDSVNDTIIIKSKATTTTTNQLFNNLSNDDLSNNKLSYQEFLPGFNAKFKIIEDIRSSQMHSCHSLLELVNNRITLLYEYTMKNK